MNRSNKQEGMTFISFMLLFVIIAFNALIALKCLPVYLEYYKVNSSLAALKSSSLLADKTPSEIYKAIQKAWEINSVSLAADQAISIEKQANAVNLILDYEREEHIVGNASVLFKFSGSYLIGQTGGREF